MPLFVRENPISASHVQLGLGSPLAALGRLSTDMSFLKIMSSDRTRHLNIIYNAGSILNVLLSTSHEKMCFIFLLFRCGLKLTEYEGLCYGYYYTIY